MFVYSIQCACVFLNVFSLLCNIKTVYLVELMNIYIYSYSALYKAVQKNGGSLQIPC